MRGLYRYNSNYKMYGLALWCPQAWAEFAILDMLGRIANKPMGAMLGDIVRSEVPYYVASGRRDTVGEFPRRDSQPYQRDTVNDMQARQSQPMPAAVMAWR